MTNETKLNPKHAELGVVIMIFGAVLLVPAVYILLMQSWLWAIPMVVTYAGWELLRRNTTH